MPTSQATPSPSKSKEVDKAVKVTVYNATGINGLAAGVKKDIATQGFTQITATNFSGTKPAQNTIYFHPDFRAEAEIIQQKLRIDMIVDRLSTDGIEVVMVKSR